MYSLNSISFYESVSFVCVFFSTCLSPCVASAALFVFDFVFITTSLFSFFFLYEFNTYLWYSYLVIRITLRICLSSFSTSMFIILIPAYVYLRVHTHFPAVPYSYTFITISTCIGCVMFYNCTHVLFVFFFFWNLIDTCVPVSIDVMCSGVDWCKCCTCRLKTAHLLDCINHIIQAPSW